MNDSELKQARARSEELEVKLAELSVKLDDITRAKERNEDKAAQLDALYDAVSKLEEAAKAARAAAAGAVTDSTDMEVALQEVVDTLQEDEPMAAEIEKTVGRLGLVGNRMFFMLQEKECMQADIGRRMGFTFADSGVCRYCVFCGCAQLLGLRALPCYLESGI